MFRSRKIPILGKHSRRITSGAWSKDGLLALGGDDKLLTVSSESGDTLRTAPLRENPSDVTFSERKQDTRSQLAEGTISLIMNKRTLYLYHIDDADNPVELAFQSKYGDVINYQW